MSNRFDARGKKLLPRDLLPNIRSGNRKHLPEPNPEKTSHTDFTQRQVFNNIYIYI